MAGEIRRSHPLTGKRMNTSVLSAHFGADVVVSWDIHGDMRFDRRARVWPRTTWCGTHFAQRCETADAIHSRSTCNDFPRPPQSCRECRYACRRRLVQQNMHPESPNRQRCEARRNHLRLVSSRTMQAGVMTAPRGGRTWTGRVFWARSRYQQTSGVRHDRTDVTPTVPAFDQLLSNHAARRG